MYENNIIFFFFYETLRLHHSHLLHHHSLHKFILHHLLCLTFLLLLILHRSLLYLTSVAHKQCCSGLCSGLKSHHHPTQCGCSATQYTICWAHTNIEQLIHTGRLCKICQKLLRVGATCGHDDNDCQDVAIRSGFTIHTKPRDKSGDIRRTGNLFMSKFIPCHKSNS